MPAAVQSAHQRLNPICAVVGRLVVVNEASPPEGRPDERRQGAKRLEQSLTMTSDPNTWILRQQMNDPQLHLVHLLTVAIKQWKYFFIRFRECFEDSITA